MLPLTLLLVFNEHKRSTAMSKQTYILQMNNWLLTDGYIRAMHTAYKTKHFMTTKAHGPT